MVGGEEHSTEYFNCFLCFQTCLWPCVVLKESFSHVSMRSNSPETLVQNFKGFSVQI